MKRRNTSPKTARITRKETEASPQQFSEESPVLLPVSVERINAANRLPNGLLSNHPVRLFNRRTKVVLRVGYRTAFFLTKTEPEYYQILSS
jgi:hypothetical protein